MHGNDKESQLIWEAYVSEEVKLRGKQIDPSQMKPDRGEEAWLSKGTRDGGEPGDDIVKTVNVEVPAGSVKPSQSAIYLRKTLGMAFGGQMVGGNLNAIISSDNHILDGHHRWAATMLTDPNVKVGGKKSQLPIADLIPVLRGAGLAYGNEGRPGGDDISIYDTKPEDVQQVIDIENQGSKFLQPGQAQQWVEQTGGFDELMKRINHIQTQYPPPAGAPPREDMPVIDADGPESGKNEVEDASTRLNKGEIDVYPPYADK